MRFCRSYDQRGPPPPPSQQQQPPPPAQRQGPPPPNRGGPPPPMRSGQGGPKLLTQPRPPGPEMMQPAGLRDYAITFGTNSGQLPIRMGHVWQVISGDTVKVCNKEAPGFPKKTKTITLHGVQTPRVARSRSNSDEVCVCQERIKKFWTTKMATISHKKHFQMTKIAFSKVEKHFLTNKSPKSRCHLATISYKKHFRTTKIAFSGVQNVSF